MLDPLTLDQMRILVAVAEAGSFSAAARRLGRMVENAAGVVGIELLAGAQGIDFHRPARSSASIERVHASIRAEVSFYAADRYFAPDIEAARNWVLGGRFADLIDLLPSRATR